MKTILKKWGNSFGIRIPKAIMHSINIDEDDEITIKVESDQLILKKADKHKTIEQLFDGFDGSYNSSEFDWGDKQGEEIW